MNTSEDTDKLRVRVIQARLQRDTDLLIGALRDPDVRDLAAKYLGDLDAHEAIEPLRPLLDARDPHARASASIALGKLGAASAMARLREIALNDEKRWVRAAAVEALGQIGGDQALQVLVELLEDRDARIRRWAATILGRLGDHRAIAALHEALSRERWTRRRPFRQAIRSIRSGSDA